MESGRVSENELTWAGLATVAHPRHPAAEQRVETSRTSRTISSMLHVRLSKSKFFIATSSPVLLTMARHTVADVPLPHSSTNSYPVGARQSESESARDGAAKHESNKSPNRKGPEEEEGTAHGRTTHLKPSWGIPFAGHSRRTGCSRCPPSSDSHP